MKVVRKTLNGDGGGEPSQHSRSSASLVSAPAAAMFSSSVTSGARRRAGLITMVPDEDEDMWHVYNLVAEGDQLRTITFRKVQKETASGGTESERIKLMLTIHVESIEFDSVSGAPPPASVLPSVGGYVECGNMARERGRIATAYAQR